MTRAERRAMKAEARAARRRLGGGVVFGAVLGVVIGLLIAPKSGRDTREQLFGAGGFGSQLDRLRGALGAGRESAADQNEALRRKIEETRERLRRQMDESGADAPGGSAGGAGAVS